MDTSILCSPPWLRGAFTLEILMQSRAVSLIEAVVNVAVGFWLAVLTQILVFPLFGLAVTLTQNMLIGCLFTLTSIARSYVLRRMFEAMRWRT